MAKQIPVTQPATKSAEEPYCPEEGDIIWINFNPQAGSEQANRRPALVLSPRNYNTKVRLCVVCPTTNQSKGYPFECAVPYGAKTSGVVLADQVKSLSWHARQSSFIEQAPRALMEEVRGKLRVLLKF
ncbi:endoribonuclease MazF [Phreatobacter sp.]|uniref:endoribonuclease MazF n=1 Tax=Phreatobacter sp. TaxID=1966341 RepID=UPI003F6EBFB8